MQQDIIPISRQKALLDELQLLRDEVSLLRNELKKSKANITNREDALFLRSGKIARRTPVTDIIMIKAESNYSMLFLSDGTQILTSKTIKHWAAKMSIYNCMIRVHRTYLVNSMHIEAFNRNTSELCLTNGLKACCSRTSRTNIRELIN